jgi:predicted deacylase
MVERRWEEFAGLSPMESWRLPVLLYRGTSGKPGAYLQAALHADEPPGVAVIHALAAQLERAEAEGRLRHNVTIVPYANPIGLSQVIAGRHLGRFHLGSGTNFNRAFPLPQAGRETAEPDPAMPLRADRALKAALLRLAGGASVILDLHCDNEAALYMYTHADLWPGAADLAARLGVAAVLLWSGSDEGAGAFEEAVTVDRLPSTAERPFLSATVELRGRRDVEPGLARRDAQAIYELLADRGILVDPGIARPAPWQGPVVGHDQVVNVPAPALGAMFLEVALGARVTQGQRLGCILADPGHAAGEVEIVAPVDGLVLIHAMDRMARPGNTVVTILAERPVPGSAAGRPLSN